MQSQLAGLLPKGQGILIDRVAKDSPAAKAGLQPYDVLLSYGNQKLHSPEQLVEMVPRTNPIMRCPCISCVTARKRIAR